MNLLKILLWELPKILVMDFFRSLHDDARAVYLELRDDVRTVTRGEP